MTSFRREKGEEEKPKLFSVRNSINFFEKSTLVAAVKEIENSFFTLVFSDVVNKVKLCRIPLSLVGPTCLLQSWKETSFLGGRIAGKNKKEKWKRGRDSKLAERRLTVLLSLPFPLGHRKKGEKGDYLILNAFPTLSPEREKTKYQVFFTLLCYSTGTCHNLESFVSFLFPGRTNDDRAEMENILTKRIEVIHFRT